VTTFEVADSQKRWLPIFDIDILSNAHG
jgi:hypothetical protein